MVRALSLFLLYCVMCLHMDTTSASEKEVLVRDRLVFLLCDQLAEYMADGKFPEEVKTMPEKYKKIKPGSGDAKGRSIQINTLKGNVSKVSKGKGRSAAGKGRSAPGKGKGGSGNRLKRNYQMTVLDLNDDQWW